MRSRLELSLFANVTEVSKHEEQIIKELIKDGVAGTWKGNAPAVRFAAIDHGRHDLFGPHGAFGEGLLGYGDKPISLR